MQAQIRRRNFGSLAALAIMLVVAAVLAVALLTTQRPTATVTSTAARPAVQTAMPAPTVDANPDSNLPICRRQGGPTC
jgi:hypothetical protein